MNKIEKEKQISELMIKLYCNKNHNTKKHYANNVKH